ncbi:MAG: GTPase ObgE [Parcubacteria group bacterium]|nr:GTPase ObgE [Parcubacteria group bacterium]
MLIDDVTIKVEAGNGGRGAVAFNKNALALGPAGGSGGDGASIYFEGVSDLGALSQFQYKKDIKAENGENGKVQFNDGATGEDLILKIPVGTVVRKIETGETVEVLKVGERILVAKGGHGGKGNFLFRSPRNTSPTEFQEGLSGERFTIRLELKLIADVGIIGLPNAGKSSLLNELTKAKSKVANYPFTTLEPALGVYYGLILADIPGLIEGASGGKGLGTKFLRHIERTKTLFHLVSAESDDPARDYEIIRNELATFNVELAEKREYVFLSKSDLVSSSEAKKKVAALKMASEKVSKKTTSISVNDWDSLEKVKKILNKLQTEK